ncbi:MAG: methyltransferase domain-containing protein [Verrucomicrobiota bacterium]
MTPDETGRSYDQIAERWNGDTFNRRNGIAAHERALAFLGDDRGGRAIDLGCGCSGRFVDLLLARGFEVEGVDVSARMIELALARHPQVRFHHADVCEWAFPHSCDFITGWDSLWHLPLSQQEPVMRKVLAALAPGGVFIFTTGGLDRAEEKTDAAMGPEVYYGVLGIPRTLTLIAGCGCVCRHLEYDQWPEKHLVVIVQKA